MRATQLMRIASIPASECQRSVHILVLVLLTSFLAEAQTEKCTYDVKRHKESIGEVRVHRHLDGDLMRYEVVTELSVDAIVRVHISYKVKAAFKHGILQASEGTAYLNGSLRTKTETIWRDGYYDVVCDGELGRIEGPIRYSGCTLYFEAPAVGSMVYSETTGVYRPILRGSDEGLLVLRNPKSSGELNTYKHAHNGKLQHVELKHRILPTLEVVRRIN